MLVKSLILLVPALLGSASAATSSKSNVASETSSTATATHTVSVGADGFNFSPHELTANVGDIIEYRFYPQNHSVARAAYGQPCIPYQYTAAGRVGFWSGFFPVELVLTDPPEFQVAVNDTEPIFFYCSAPGACFQGMVGVVNPNSTYSFDNQFLFSQNATETFSPDQNPFPEEEAPTRTTTATGATMTPTPSQSFLSSSTAAASRKAGLGAGPIVGIVIGALAFVALAGVVVYMCGRQKTIKEILRLPSTPPAHTSYQPGPPGLSEAKYPNVQNLRASSPVSRAFRNPAPYGPGTDTESYRSASPPTDERTAMMQGQHGVMSPGSFSPGRPHSPGSSTISDMAPIYSETAEQDGTLKPSPLPLSHPIPDAPSSGPHELEDQEYVPDSDIPRPWALTADGRQQYRGLMALKYRLPRPSEM